jgi:hypothetical protein
LKKELSEMIFLNDIVRFRVPGLTHRKSGTFIEIKTENPLKNNEYNQRYVGVYLVLEVQHIFIGNIYETIISATKTYKSK